MDHQKLPRRAFLAGLAFGILAVSRPFRALAQAVLIEPLTLDRDTWVRRLTPEQFRILREHGTEPAFSSPLHAEKRKGAYHCAGCDLLLFTSAMKFDSGTGWPSFFDVHQGHIGTSIDTKLLVPRTEYHCARCGGHHGHVFRDGPAPTGLRYCNNGAALTFRAAE